MADIYIFREFSRKHLFAFGYMNYIEA